MRKAAGDDPPSRIKVLKIFRAALTIYLIGLIALDTADLIAFGRISAFIVAVPVFMLAVITFQTFVIRRDRVLNRPRPDYPAIATMEREIWGEAFEHEGAPSRSARRAVIEPRPERLPEGYARCPRGHGYHARHDDRPRCFECEDERHAERCPDTTVPATLDQYAAWLRGYIKRGGKPTHFHDHPFKGFRYAGSATLVIDSGYEFGARSREIVVARGVETQRTNPAGLFDGWGHSSLYFMHGYRTNKPGFVPVYSDPEFDFARRDDEHRSNLRWERRS